jgi:DNA-binding protein H-NS
MPSELGGCRGEHSDASPALKYRHPENPDLSWSGGGRQPTWIREAIDAGRSLTDFEIRA